MPTLQPAEVQQNLTLRRHQEAAVRIAKEMALGKARTALFNVVPGGGKSLLPLVFHREIAATNRHVKIGWFVPRDSLRHQAALEARKKFGITLNDCKNQLNPSKETSGFVTTHQSLLAQPQLWEHEFRKHDYLLVVDELHHAAVDADGDDGKLARALDRLPYKYRLGMTGTLARNDRQDIWSVQYLDSDGYRLAQGGESADRYIRYSRADALGEDAIVPLEFFHTDGPVRYLDPECKEEIEWERLSQVDRTSQAKALFTALKTEYAEQLLESCVDHWRINGAKLLVACLDQHDAKQYHARLRNDGHKTFLAISDHDEAAEDIKRFRNIDSQAILVTCQMAYEGLDVPDISHICSLTNIRSVPWNLQLFGRAWRKIPGKDRAYCFCPDDPKMNQIIGYIKSEEERVYRTIDTSEREAQQRDAGPADSRILPLSGEVRDIRRSALDGEPTSAVQDEFAALVKKIGRSLDDPELAAAWRKLGVPAIPTAAHATYSEERSLVKGRLSDACRSRDSRNGSPFSTTERVVYRRFGCGVNDMTIDQLKEAFCYVENLDAR